MPGPIHPSSLDHVALWVDERNPLASFLCDHLGMHVIEETETFTLVGVDAKLGKLTLFDADGPRDRGSIEHIALRVGNLDAAVAGLPQTAAVQPSDGGLVRFEGPGGVPLALIERGGVEFDLDHVLLRLPDRDAALIERELRIVEGGGAEVERPLLNHIALLVDSADEVQRDAEQRGVEIDDIKDAPNTLAVFLRGPSGVRIEYVEHKPGFALV